MAERIVGWRIADGDRTKLLERFPPRYSEIVADHVTHGRADEAPPLPDAPSASVIGHADDGAGVEALVVAIGGSPARWDGSRYHITWSLAPGREAKESNDVIATRGWEPVERNLEVRLIAADWP
ncbi:hypothetical protein ACWPM1_11380 [Tsuneonella sp. HG249]